MAEYIGGRIVPTHGGVWDKEKSYEELTIVLNEATGDSYISKRPVPAGTEIYEEHYWMLYSQYSEQVTRAEDHLDDTASAIRSEMDEQARTVNQRMDQAEENVDKRARTAEKVSNDNKAVLETRMANIEARQDANVKASTTPDADYAAEVVDARVDAADTAYPSLGAHLRSIETGEAVAAIEDRKIKSFDVSLAHFYDLGIENCKTYPGDLNYEYDGAEDKLTITALRDVDGDRILYARIFTPQEYAEIYRRDGNFYLHMKVENVVNNSKAFKMSIMPFKCYEPDSDRGFIVAGSRFSRAFTKDDGDFEVFVPVRINREMEYNEEMKSFTFEGSPMSCGLLIYANSPRMGECITLSGFGSIMPGISSRGRVNTAFQNLLQGSFRELEKKVDSLNESDSERKETDKKTHDRLLLDAYSDCNVIDFEPIYEFGFTDSIGEVVVDEFGDESYTLEFVNNSPMFGRGITNEIHDSCDEVIVEVTARTLTDGGKLRVQLFDPNNGMSHSSHTSYHPITKDYRRYQFRLIRENGDSTMVGIGPERIAGNKVQFKDVKILIPHEESRQMRVLSREFYGYTGNVDFSQLEAVTFDDPILMGTDDYAKNDGMYLDTIEFYSNFGNINPQFRIGCIDQYGLFQEVSSFSLHCRKGRNYLKADRWNIKVPAGNGVFMRMTPDIALYKGGPAVPFHNLLSRTSVTINENGYSGNPLKETDLFVPLRYTLREKSFQQKFEELGNNLAAEKDDLDSLESRVNVLEGGSVEADVDKVKLYDPNGVKFHLTVGTDGALHTIRSIPKKALFIGNSLLFGFTTFGMAASDSNHDYYHYVTEFLKSKNPDVVTKKAYGSNWESGTTSEARQEWINNTMEASVDGDEDLVVIQLADNVNSADRRVTFQEDLFTMITAFRKNCPNARIVWVAAWYNTTPDWPYITKAVDDLHIDLVDIRDIAALAENKNVIGGKYTTDTGEVKEITSAGVASHPGDLGMKRIADRLIEHLQKYM